MARPSPVHTIAATVADDVLPSFLLTFTTAPGRKVSAEPESPHDPSRSLVHVVIPASCPRLVGLLSTPNIIARHMPGSGVNTE